MSYILKRLTTMPVAYTGEMSSIKGVWYKPHYRNHVLLSSPYNLFANCRARARDEKERKKELEELIRKIHSSVKQLEHCLLDKELFVLHCFPLVSVLPHTPAKMYLATLTKLPCSSNILSLFCAYL